MNNQITDIVKVMDRGMLVIPKKNQGKNWHR